MQLGNFFESAATCQPINPKPVKFTAIASGKVLPGGHKNTTGGQHRATVTAALVFLSGEETAEARLDARRALRERCVDPMTKLPVPFTEEDFNIEYTYHLMWRALHEFDEAERKAGDQLFPSVSSMQKLVLFHEANRVCGVYNAYIADEHPEVVAEDATFRSSEGGG